MLLLRARISVFSSVIAILGCQILYGAGSGKLTISSLSLEFGSVQVDSTSAPLTLRVANESTVSITITEYLRANSVFRIGYNASACFEPG